MRPSASVCAWNDVAPAEEVDADGPTRRTEMPSAGRPAVVSRTWQVILSLDMLGSVKKLMLVIEVKFKCQVFK